MPVELTPDLLAEVQEALGLPHVALVEKDFHVARALAALSRFNGDPRLVFGGGTALSRAHRITKRMSEDIDLKIVSDNPLTQGQRRAFRAEVANALLDAGFAFDPANPADLLVENGGKKLTFNLNYPTVVPALAALRPFIKVELSVSPCYGEPVLLPITSFVNEVLGLPPEVPEMPCAPIQETAAEKFVALTRRVGQERLDGPDRDATLVRHIYDLSALDGRHSHSETGPVLLAVVAQERKGRGNRFPAYAADPRSEIIAAISALRTDPAYEAAFAAFQRDMVYGDAAEFAQCLDVLDALALLMDDVER